MRKHLFTPLRKAPNRYVAKGPPPRVGSALETGAGEAVIAMDDTGNGSKVVRHFKTVVSDQSEFITRVNDAAFSFLPFTGAETDAVLQFDASGEHLAMFALGFDRNGDGLLNSADGEIGPAFGVYDRKFRIQEANLGTAHDDGFSEGGGDGNSGNDWYRIQLRIDFTGDGGEGTGSLYFLNLTDGNTVYRSVSGLRDIPLGMSRISADAGPARWNVMWLHLLSMGSRTPSADNLVPNFNRVRVTDLNRVGPDLILHWRGGVGPYQVQWRTSLDTGTWEEEGGPTMLTTATVAIAGGSGFLRVIRP